MKFLDPDIQFAHIRLLDVICSWERATGREMTLILIPWNVDDPVVVSISGKPISGANCQDILNACGMAMDSRFLR